MQEERYQVKFDKSQKLADVITSLQRHVSIVLLQTKSQGLRVREVGVMG